ncbi:MAG: HD domain-containing protein [Bdellovibrionaceae bacterium]|nr:HD domain-containing protein [Pseudobdellovibrionaceae bacterium]
MLEIRDPFHGFIAVSSEENLILRHPFFSRLRFIKQLGFTEFSFPGASHSRFIHSLGTCHLVSKAFDVIFKNAPCDEVFKKKLKKTVRLAGLLHDIGHGPLSHVAEVVMPPLSELNMSDISSEFAEDRQASHEDFSLKFILQSDFTKIINENFECDAIHVACLINKNLNPKNDFFIYEGIDYRPILSQLVSSELDMDRMDYLQRDAYYCGTKYGEFEFEWILNRLTWHQHEGAVYLALDHKALYSFDDYLLSRQNMYLMVYCHHRSVIYDEMLRRYFAEDETPFVLPAKLEEYHKCTDFWLYQILAKSKNVWAQRISTQTEFAKVKEWHSAFLNSAEPKAEATKAEKILKDNNITYIRSHSKMKMSNYYNVEVKNSEIFYPIFIKSKKNAEVKAVPIEECTDIFQKYAQSRYMIRLYVDPKDKLEAQKILK